MDKSEFEKGKKNNLQFTTAEKEYFERECGFTDEELEIFRLRARGKTVIEISFTMTDLHGKELPTGYYTVSKVEDRRVLKDIARDEYSHAKHLAEMMKRHGTYTEPTADWETATEALHQLDWY